MLLYHVRMALKSLRRSLGLSAVIVGGIALGIGVASLFSTIRHSLAKDPIPRKSGASARTQATPTASPSRSRCSRRGASALPQSSCASVFHSTTAPRIGGTITQSYP